MFPASAQWQEPGKRPGRRTVGPGILRSAHRSRLAAARGCSGTPSAQGRLSTTAMTAERARVVLLVLALVAATASCVNSDPKTAPEAAPVPSFAQYEASVLAYRDCMQRAGHPVSDLVRTRRGPLDVYQYSVPAGGVSSGADDRCYLTLLEPTERAWLTQLTAYYQQHPEEDLTYRALTACVAKYHVQVKGQLSVNSMSGALTAAGVNVAQCIVTATSDQG